MSNTGNSTTLAQLGIRYYVDYRLFNSQEEGGRLEIFVSRQVGVKIMATKVTEL